MDILTFTLLLYLVAMLGVGFYFAKKGLSESEYLLGGGKLPGWVLAFSERATAESAWLLMGATGFVFATGLSGVWILVGSAIGIFASWIFLAKRFMVDTHSSNALTFVEFITAKFGKRANAIRVISAITIGAFFLFYIAGQFAGAGKTLWATFGWEYQTAIIITAVMIVIYSAAGGFVSVVWTDMVQALLMVIAAVVVPILAFVYIQQEGLSISQALVSAGDGADSWTGGLTGFAAGVLVFNNFAWAFGFLGGQPQLSMRFMALKNEKEVKTARTTAIIWTILAYAGIFGIGITGLTIYGAGYFDDVELLMPTMISDFMPPAIAGILLAGILAALMSTADSQLIVLTGTITNDIVNKGLGIKLTEAKRVMLARIVIVIAGAIAFILALTTEDLVYMLVSWAWAGVGCTFSAVIILTFFWKKYSGAGVIATIVTGFISTVIWMTTPLEEIITSRAATFFIAGIVGIIVSLLVPDEEE